MSSGGVSGGVELLEKRENVVIRTSSNLKQRQGSIGYSRYDKSLAIVLKAMQQDDEDKDDGDEEGDRQSAKDMAFLNREIEMEPISLAMLERVEARDYHSRGSLCWTVLLVCRDGSVDEGDMTPRGISGGTTTALTPTPYKARQISVEFKKKETRDAWEYSLRAVWIEFKNQDAEIPQGSSVTPSPRPKDPAPGAKPESAADKLGTDRNAPELDHLGADKTKAGRVRTITQVNLQRPSPGVLAAMAMELDNSSHLATLEVMENKSSVEECKKIVGDFVVKYGIVPAESLSLYRYLRSVIQRATIEREVETVIQKISLLQYEQMLSNSATSQPNATPEDIWKESKDGLDRIQETLSIRIGTHGAGAIIVSKILRRSVEKMKLINDMSHKIHMNKT